MDFAAAGLLDGLEGDERAARLELLEPLAADGVSLEELQAAVAEDRLVLLPLERALGARYTAGEVAERAGLDVDQVVAYRRALGLPEPGPDDRVFGEVDVAAYEALTLFLESGLPQESVTELNRVLAEGMARFAAAFLGRGDTEHDVALRFSEMAETLASGAAAGRRARGAEGLRGRGARAGTL